MKIQFTGRNFILIRIRISINKYIDNMDNMPERKMFGVVIRTMREMIKNKMIFFFKLHQKTSRSSNIVVLKSITSLTGSEMGGKSLH